MREIKIRVYFEVHNSDFTKSIKTHYTTVDRLTNGLDTFKYNDVNVIDKVQYTGLEDIDDVEIYEKDIVTCHGYVGNLVVEYKHDYVCTIASFVLCDSNGNVVFSDFDRVKVIGNEFENPELLKEQNNG